MAHVEKPVNYIKFQDLDNFVTQILSLKYVGSIKLSYQLPDKNKKVVQIFGFVLFLLPCVEMQDVTEGRKPNSSHKTY